MTRMTDEEWAKQRRWEKSPAKKLYAEAERARTRELALTNEVELQGAALKNQDEQIRSAALNPQLPHSLACGCKTIPMTLSRDDRAVETRWSVDMCPLHAAVVVP